MRRCRRDHGHVDAVAIEKREAPLGQVVVEIDIAARLGSQLQLAAAEARRLGTPLERPDERFRPEVLVEVDGRHGQSSSTIGSSAAGGGG